MDVSKIKVTIAVQGIEVLIIDMPAVIKDNEEDTQQVDRREMLYIILGDR